jgi:ubiquinone biosynthesis protein UbiJ
MEVIQSLAIRALNHLMHAESWAPARLLGHAGALVTIDSGPFVLRLGIDERGYFQAGDEARQPDVIVTLPSDIAARALFERDTLFASVKLGGAADIAESLAFVLRNLRWDAEGDLADLIGDIPARRLSLLAQSTAVGIQRAIGNFADNFTEYAVEESGLLAAHRDVGEFGNSVATLRDDVARLEKRISRL